MLYFDSKQTAKKYKRKFLGTSSNLNHKKAIHKKVSYSKYYLKNTYGCALFKKENKH